MDEICKFIRGPFAGALKKEIFISDGYALHEQSHAIYGNFSSFRYFIEEEKYNELKRFAVQPHDIIMSCSGTMGKFAIISEHSKKGVINQALLKLTVKSGYNTKFIKATLELPLNQNKLLSQSAGGAIKNVVEVAQIKEIKLLIPSDEEQQKISSFFTFINDLINAQTQKLEALELHKKGLLQRMFPDVNEVKRMSADITIYLDLGALVTHLRSLDKKYILLFAYIGTGKTRLLMDFRQANKQFDAEGNVTKRDTLYFNAFTEDLFSWDNDLQNEAQRVLKLNKYSRFFDGLKELEMDNKIRPLLQQYSDFNFKINYEIGSVIFERQELMKSALPMKFLFQFKIKT